MDCRIDRALRNMFLRRKLRAIEAQRIKYPETTEGRKQFIEDSLKPKNQVLFYILIVIGISGMVVTGLFFCSFLLFILSMLLFLAGVQGIERREP
jgi:hypothetical protein